MCYELSFFLNIFLSIQGEAWISATRSEDTMCYELSIFLNIFLSIQGEAWISATRSEDALCSERHPDDVRQHSGGKFYNEIIIVDKDSHNFKRHF